MKIEAEVEHSVFSFQHSSAAEGQGGGGCPESGAEPCPSAQERSSIDRPEWQQQQKQPPGCGGCGRPSSSSSADSDHNNNNNSSSSVGLPSVFDCEHFQFIDEDDEEGVSPDHNNADVVPATEASSAGGSPPDVRPTSRDDAEVSSSSPQQQQQQEMGESESAARGSSSRSHAVKRQVSFDAPPACDCSSYARRELRSVLKKTPNKRTRNRVTFDEAVTLYSDENGDVRTLALTTGPDIVYTDVFYMFEPPIEYQDVPPFEPPAEYRDSEEQVATTPQLPAVVDTQTDATNDAVSETPIEPEEPSVPPEAATTTNEQIIEEPPTPDLDTNLSNVAVSQETENTDSATEELTTTTTNPETGQQQQIVNDSTLESDKLFERFLEAEREFAVDEELNSVFHALEADFANDDKNGALDDNFFRKLISLLSSAEGDSTDTAVDGNDYFTEANFAKLQVDLCEDDDNSQAHSRTLSEADSDCSISSQDTIIVRFGEDESEQTTSAESASCAQFAKSNDAESSKDVPDDSSSSLPSERSETFDEVFTEVSESASSSDEKPPRPLPRESLLIKNNHVSQAIAKLEKAANGESLSRQSSGEQSVNSGNSQDPPQDADDSTSSDSRSGEVEEEIRLDDIGYDEEDAEDYDEESFRGMAHGNSKIRRIIKKNALQCTLFRGIEAKRRQQPGAKYPRPKSPLLSQESLVEKLKWLTTIDEHKDANASMKFHSKPPDVILSTGGVPVNGSMPHSASSEDDISNQTAQGFQQSSFYQMQQRHVPPPNNKSGYYVRRDGFPPTHHPSLPRQRVAFSGHPQQMMHTLPYSQNRVVAHPPTSQVQWSEQQRPVSSSMTVPRNFRDWRVIQRITGNRSSEGGSSSRSSQVPADYVRCPNGSIAAYPVSVPPDVSRTSNKDELEQFVEKESKRMDTIRKRYSVAEEEDDPTFGFARRPSVRGVQSRIQSNPSENIHGHGTNKVDPYTVYEEHAQGPPQPGFVLPRPAAYPNEQVRIWSRDPSWIPDNMAPSTIYGPPTQGGRSQAPMHIHRASVALTELPGNATIPYTHRKPHPDTRYHSYAESMYGSTRTLPTKGWLPPDPRTCHVPNPAHQTVPLPNMPPAVSPPMLQVPPHSASKDERGVPEGASSSPKISSDSLYHAPVPDAISTTGGPHKEDGVIYYSLNV